MKIYEYGRGNPERILLIHPSLVTWDYFENVIPLLEQHYHLLIPALPGYDLKDNSEFSSVEKIASRLADELLQKGIREVKAIYGCSMGGSIVLRMAVDGKLKARHYVMDGGITPYQLPWILTRLIALRDFGMMVLGKLGMEYLRFLQQLSDAEASPAFSRRGSLLVCGKRTQGQRLGSEIYEEVCSGYGFQKLCGNGSRRHGAVLSGTDGAGAFHVTSGIRRQTRKALTGKDTRYESIEQTMVLQRLSQETYRFVGKSCRRSGMA